MTRIIRVPITAISTLPFRKSTSFIPEGRWMGIDVIAFCMGLFGCISRVLAHLMGSYISFVPLETGEESAPGLMTIKEMKWMMERFS